MNDERSNIDFLNNSLDVLCAVINRIEEQKRELAKLAPSRSVSLAVTKLDEAAMWLEREQSDLAISLAHITCR